MALSTVELRLLGPLELLHGGTRVELPQSKKARALLGYLVATGREHTRERLCTLLWTEPDNPRAALRWCLTKIRPLVDQPGAPRITADRERIGFSAEGAHLDLFTLRAALGGTLNDLPTPSLEAAARLFRGDFLEGIEPADCHAFREWVTAERESHAAAQRKILDALITRLFAEPERALPFARARVGLDPLDEDAQLRVIELCLALGRRSEAEAQAEACRRAFRVELAGHPSARIAAALRQAPVQLSPSLKDPPPSPRPAVAALIGRINERAVLDAELGQLIAHAGPERLRGPFRAPLAVLVLLGEPGIGKSSLLRELARTATERGAMVLRGRAFEAEAARPYGPWVDAMRGASRPGWSPADRLAPLLERAPGVDDRARLHDAFVALVREGAARAPLLVVIDDLQWIDEASAALLHHAARELSGKVLFACAARSGEVGDNAAAVRLLRALTRERLSRTLALAPLSDAAIAELVGEVAPAELARIVEESEGNPLFALELARGGGGALPASVEEAIGARLEHCPDRARALLPWLASIGRSCSLSLVSEACGLPISDILQALDELDARALVRPSSAEEYDFAHDLVRRVAYQRISMPQRKLIHARIARALDAQPDLQHLAAGEVARHAELAGDAERCAQAALRAGRRCLSVFAYRDAERFSELGRRQASGLADPLRIPLQVSLLSLVVHPGLRLRSPGPLAAEVVRLAAEAEAAGLPTEAGQALYLLARLQAEAWSDLPKARSTLEQSFNAFARASAPDPSLLASAVRCLAILEVDMPRVKQTLEVLSRLGPTASEGLYFQWSLGIVLRWEGDAAGARASLGRAIEQARRAHDHWAEFECASALAIGELEMGQPGRALALCAPLAEVAQRLGEGGTEAQVARAIAALAQRALEDGEAARAEEEAALGRLAQESAEHALAWFRNFAATLDLAAGDLRRGERNARAGLASAERSERSFEIEVGHALLGAIARREGRDAEATAQLGHPSLADPACWSARTRGIVADAPRT